MDLSVVIPLFNEEDSVDHLCKAVLDALVPLNLNFEILLVDDGSRDSTCDKAAKWADQDSRIRVIQFRRNFGQTPAMAAGIDHARGKTIVTMDGDLQNDPTDIPLLLKEIDDGCDIAVGWRHNRQDKLVSRKIPSRIANRLIAKVTGVPIKDNGCSLKAYRADVMKNVPFYSEMHRFIPALLSLSGARVAEVKVKHHARQFGVSKYGLSRTYKVLLDLLTIKTILSLVRHPTYWFMSIGLIPLLISFFCGIFTISSMLNDQSPIIGATISLLFFSLGLFLALMGLLAEIAYQKGNFKVMDIAPLTARYFEQPEAQNSNNQARPPEPVETEING